MNSDIAEMNLEQGATEILEFARWNGKPECPRCESESVRQVKSKSGGRNKRFLWRCHSCKKQFTVRIGSELENCKISALKLINAIIECKNAFQAYKLLGISYMSALFLFDRIREPRMMITLKAMCKQGMIKKAGHRSFINIA